MALLAFLFWVENLAVLQKSRFPQCPFDIDRNNGRDVAIVTCSCTDEQ